MMLHRLSTIRSGTRSPGAEKRKRELLYLLPCISTVGLLTIGSMMLGCIGSGGEELKVYAEEVDVPVAVANDGVLPEIALTVSNTNLTDTAGSAMATVSATTQLKVTAKNTDAYNIYVQSTSANSKLVGQVSGSTIDPIVGTSTYSNLPAGSWGYALGEGEGLVADNNNLSYRAVPTNTNTVAPAYSSTEEVEGKGFTLAFAAKFSADQPADHYKTNVVVSVAATPEEVVEFPGFEKIVFMQDLTPKVCLEASIGETKQLYDTRDMKSYWVTKLADGNCWMTQNLDYDDPKSNKVTSTGGVDGGPSSGDWKNDSSVRQYWDPGEKIVDKETGLLIDANIATSKDRHYLVGNYYSWAAVTDGTGTNLTTPNMNATGSICPAGWQLPVAGGMNGSFGVLLSAYGLSGLEGVESAMKAPLYLTTGGSISNNTLGFPGNGLYLTSTVANNTVIYHLTFGPRYDGFSIDRNNGARYVGYMTRCLVDTTFDAITYMDEMTADICNRATENDTKQLIDRRDNKSYWVTKLADGKCWMTQNLDYDITTEDIPNIRRYDVTTGLNPQTEPAKTNIGRWPDNTIDGSDGIPRYYDPGYYYKTNVTDWTFNTSCHNQANGFTNAGCEAAGFKTTGDAHFSVGNYYNWYAATKGSGTNNTVGEASESICPAGWQLPESNVDKAGSFGTAITTGTKQSNSLAGKYEWSDDEVGALIPRKAPTYFVPSGDVRSGALLYAGLSAFYWSSTAPSDTGNAYVLLFDSSRVSPASSYFVSFGFSVRCVNK